MALGPGKYDDAATVARTTTQAEGVVLIVIDGQHGNGFSVQSSPALLRVLPQLLRTVANEIERDQR